MLLVLTGFMLKSFSALDNQLLRTGSGSCPKVQFTRQSDVPLAVHNDDDDDEEAPSCVNISVQ